jgi:hypothetical protein
MLAWAFVSEFSNAMGKTIEAIPQAGMESLQRYGWPGNVRELRNVIERAMIVSGGGTLRVSLSEAAAAAPARSGPLNLRELERQTIADALARAGRCRGRGTAGDQAHHPGGPNGPPGDQPNASRVCELEPLIRLPNNSCAPARNRFRFGRMCVIKEAA